MGNKLLEKMSKITATSKEAVSDILVLEFTIVNACLIGDPMSDNKDFVLVDTGLENSADFILESIDKRFGKGNKPQCIILTHGHFDHVGSVVKLSEQWDVPVYIHELELPYVIGKKDYPLADPSVDGGGVSRMSKSFPHTSIDIEDRVEILPPDGSVPGMSGWKWIHTPGHTEGHISLFREIDRVIIAGDVFSTTKQESLISVITQKQEISGPPAYLTVDWKAAKESIINLRQLNPYIAIPSHGKSMRGKQVTDHLDMLIEHFDEIAKSEQGKFLDK
ncbi:MBL fold metallo-hydrolase [Schnuerera sp. xch1]|uniref:MBL fold metallo-hydrolase n=1 Tax=Schnuerera sp. xch1 TaxID=2874283 RepID=UPI001CBC79DC|nr:MBL fold metallo-hydrolase [Schnuerera sp. xch1]MBZ2175007.1 MBL fold metallo-hydrolase [Schnuerera sp. xch1]